MLVVSNNNIILSGVISLLYVESEDDKLIEKHPGN